MTSENEANERDGESVENCFVLELDNDRAAWAALKTYVATTKNEELAEDLREQFDLELTPQQEWEAHNEPFNYDSPELPGGAWSPEQYQELYDRCIRRQEQWFCDKCSGCGPFHSLQKARSHVKSEHGQDLIEEHETPREELETATDGGTSTSGTEQRESENHGLGDFQ